MALKLVDMHKVPFDKSRHVRIDRRSIWGNPFPLSDKKDHGERMDVLWKYTLYLLRNQALLARVRRLKNKTLACWCYPDNECHGQIFIYLTEHLGIVDKCLTKPCDREKIAEEIFAGLGWEHKKRYEQTTLF